MFRKTLIRCLNTLSKKEDVVSVKNLTVNCITGKDYWSRPVLQPLEISIDLKTSFKKAAETDDLKYSLNYATISRNILEYFNKHGNKNFHSLELISDAVFQVILNKSNGSNGELGKVTLTNRKSEIRCANVELELNKKLSKDNIIPVTSNILKINELKLLTLIGIFNFERLQKQIVDLNIEITYENKLEYSKLILDITKYVESAQFKTVEALVENVSYIILKSSEQISETKVGVWKPNAILFSNGVGVSVVRNRSDLSSMTLIKFDSELEENSGVSLPNFNTENQLVESNNHIAFIAFGSNHGDPFSNIYQALDNLQDRGIKLLATSTIYESKPMYFLDQPNFYNGVIKVSTSLKPYELLSELKEIEYEELKRVKLFDNGPRSIDLDILLYDELILNEPDLKIPHISMIDRTFVMAPLCELVSPDAVHPVTAETFHSHLSQLLQKDLDPTVQESNRLINVVPYKSSYLSFDTFDNTGKTMIMGILNITPDSFSDGGVNLDITLALQTVESMIENDVDIIDIGGCSTRPGSEQPSEEEEMARVIPVIEKIREQHNKIIISVDTYRSKVAEAAILAGADIINDISSGLFDDLMFDVVAKYRVPYIMNHTRGNIDTMTKLTDYSATAKDDIQEFHKSEMASLSEDEHKMASIICKELLQQISLATSKGVYKWQIILDPGIGFAKTTQQNLSLIRATNYIKNLSFQTPEQYFSMNRLPVLLGPSRKKFIGNITKVDQLDQRLIGNVSTIMACIGFGADIVRVHDYKEMKQVRMMGDAIYKKL